MNNEEKILEMLEKLNGTVEKHGEMLEKLNGTVEKHGEMLEKLNGTVEQHSKLLEQLQIDVSGIKVRLDVEVKKRFDLLAEGQQIIREIMVPGERVEEVEADVSALKTTVRIHSQDIAELKKAQ